MSEPGTVLYYVGMAGKYLSREDIVIAVRHTLEDKGNEIMQTIAIAEQWIAEGFDKGIEQGTEQGRVQMLQEDILDLLYARFGLASEEVAARITAVTDIPTLRQLLRKAGTLETADAFIKLLADLP
ncbi:MAG: hypothetical protein KF770_25285 [Anaerolineae bacterium]|nr:hypothetical protein [Anaerolineae bacterium]